MKKIDCYSALRIHFVSESNMKNESRMFMQQSGSCLSYIRNGLILKTFS